ncbi:hypothetical protein G0U57_009280 [Chelydra serpentina]|uniref:Uncharacterized protein n=1 Tax=Chelydra serpentina TaxID=8475 RepID=A0A8T1SG35_CHESE|nr:hypothetical protein G0U57_009280 [Chelydra serpentina]
MQKTLHSSMTPLWRTRNHWTALHQTAKMNDKDGSSMDLKRTIGIELTEPVPRREHKKVTRSIAVYAVLHHCLREKIFEDGEGCVIGSPGQRHDCVTWTSEDINCELQDLCPDLCLENVLNAVIAIGYAIQCLFLTQDNRYQMFDLQKELTYCQKDVNILRQACILSREEIVKMSETGDIVETP